ncbi:testis-expressed protein 19.2-like [Marmota monax]|uniref:Testis-expressed protein 19.2 n=1 Tax=Marmota monax TaxID=9995 RepID=A0A5E4BQ92_MARMO|nr:testis-expressed protein 19.2-like [Marmota monax]XP_046319139.1 testis-expressed protein 19.2-like [Marmota monax]VTJ71058.1 Hypothetical predicted protein [Marmota monax]VTJ71059.1 Hypothetical predicted protein [Marmota monax]
MCPPVSVRQGREGMSCLYASWLYQIQHGDELSVCFACFKVAFLDLKDMLESEDWEDEDWDPETAELLEAGPEQEGFPGQPGQGGAEPWGPGALASAPAGSEEVGLDPLFVPTELGPQNAVPLGLGPEDADWTQALPWRFEGLPPCSHWPRPPSPWQNFLGADLPPGEPMVLELGTSRPVEPVEPEAAEAWLLGLQVVSMVGCQDAVYLRRMVPGWALQTPGQRWKLLLEPGEVWVVRLQHPSQQQDLHRWELSVLEGAGPGAELVPADCALQKRGFTIVSCSPCSQREAEEGASAAKPRSCPQGQDASPAEPWSGVPERPGESLAVVGASVLGELPCFQPFRPGPQN